MDGSWKAESDNMQSLKKRDNRRFPISNDAGEVDNVYPREKEVGGVDDLNVGERRGIKFSPGMLYQMSHDSLKSEGDSMKDLKKGDNRHFRVSNDAGEFFHSITYTPERENEVDGVDLCERWGIKFSPVGKCVEMNPWVPCDAPRKNMLSM